MTELEAPHRPVSRLRIAAGVVFAIIALALAVLYTAGAVNPWHYVVLRQWFGVPTRGFVLVMVATGVALVLLTPVRSEARQRLRTTARAVVVVLLAVGLICWGLTPQLGGADTTVLATSADKQRQVALYEYGGDDRELIVWAGTGLTAREAGSAGSPCGDTVVTFLSRDRFEVTTSYGHWEIHLDEATGEPLNQLGPTCSG